MALITSDLQEKLKELLVEEGLIERQKLKEYEDRAKEENTPFLTLLVNDNAVTDEELTRLIARVSGTQYVNLQDVQVNPRILELLPRDIAERFMAVPIGEVQNRLALAMIDTNNVQAVDYLSSKIGRPLKVYMASDASIRAVLEQYKTDFSSVDAAVSAVQSETQKEERRRAAEGDIKTIVQDSPISRALSKILEYAARNRASDIHIEPLENSLKIRCRIDGVLREIMQLPKSIEPALVSRIKILSNLKIDEHRIPQDGQFAVNVAGKEIDLRIAISPVVWGEQVVIRLLDKSGSSFDIEEMGYAGRALRTIRKGIRQPNGMVLNSGPT